MTTLPLTSTNEKKIFNRDNRTVMRDEIDPTSNINFNVTKVTDSKLVQMSKNIQKGNVCDLCQVYLASFQVPYP